MTDSSTADRELVVSRTFDAPRELVYQAWTDPAHLPEWWGPFGFTVTTHSIEVREGGVWRYTMHGPDGTDFPNRVEYLELTPPERIVLKNGTDDDHDFYQATITFVDRDQQTDLTMRSVFRTAEDLALVVEKYGALEGAHQTLARLADHLLGMPR